MADYRIFTDSCCDLPAKLADELRLSVLPLSVLMEGREYINYLDWREISPEDYYQALRDGKMATTSAISAGAFEDGFREALAAGEDIIYLAFSSALSTTYQSSCIAAETLREEFPERKIICIDTLCASLGQGLLVYNAAQQKRAGLGIEELRDWVEQNKGGYAHWVVADDLMHLMRGGRVSKTSAIVGTLVGIKPIIHVDEEGRLIKKDTVRGRKAALKHITAKVGELHAAKGQVMMICHSDCYEEACGIAEALKKEYGAKEVIINWIGPVIGAHTGPGTIAVFFTGDGR